MIDISKTNADIVPLFIKDPDGNLEIIPSNSQDVDIDGNKYILVYLGKNIVTENQFNYTDSTKED